MGSFPVSKNKFYFNNSNLFRAFKIQKPPKLLEFKKLFIGSFIKVQHMHLCKRKVSQSVIFNSPEIMHI